MASEQGNVTPGLRCSGCGMPGSYHSADMHPFRYYEPPEDLAGTVFDPCSWTLGPIMAAIQAGEFEHAARLLRILGDRTPEEMRGA